jgi:hypothetical protein
LGITFPTLFASSDKSVDAVYAILGSGAYAVFEGFCLNAFGTSLGKRLYGINLIRDDNEGFTLSLSLKRSLAVWVRGLGFGIAIASFVTLIVAYQTLTREGESSWDRDFQCTITHSKLSILRWMWILIVWLLTLSIYVLLATLRDYLPIGV